MNTTLEADVIKVKSPQAGILDAQPKICQHSSRTDVLKVDSDNRVQLIGKDRLSSNFSTLVDSTRWCLDFFTMAGRKAENQDSLLITTCLPYQLLRSAIIEVDSINEHTQLTQLKMLPAPLLVLMADGVSACQFPKQASQMVINTVADKITLELSKLVKSQYESLVISEAQLPDQTLKLGELISFDDNQVAGIIKTAVNKANDLLCYPQAYQRVPPLLSTLSGLLCIGDRIHLFHTGDSRIYRVGIDSLIQLSRDHRIHRGQDKGALSAAIGADARTDIQQSVFTLHQDECLVVMTDGVYEHIDATELQFELCNGARHAFESIASTQTSLLGLNISQNLCEQAFTEGSSDNLSMMLLSMNTLLDQTITSDAIIDSKVLENSSNVNDSKLNKSDNENTDFEGRDITRYQLPTGLEVGDHIDGFTVTDIIARTARSDVYLVQDEDEQQYVLKSPSLDTIEDGYYLRDFLKERKIGLSLSKHRRAGESAYNQADPNNLPNNELMTSASQPTGSRLSASGLLRYYPVPASSTYLYHLTEYIEGESLREFISRNAPFDVWQTYDLLTKIGMAVRVMHRNYLLHQDIKPENVLLTKSGAVKLIDFGSAGSMILQDSTRPPNGDLHYAAPEYYSDAPKGVHSDLFSIAVIGYELLTGQLPFSSQDLMNPKHTLVMPTQPLRQHKVPEAVQQALMLALHPNTNARHQAIGEFLQNFNPDNKAYRREPEPLIERNPLLLWQGICATQAMIIIYLLWLYLS